ncbi:hypothetical protein ACG04R_14835 [Roseateles sp. BYS78W]|uniref:Uncharacterized protein n=1 Tax=Pelomonas candidula TaxID=3299025 RepID=A0ABW7HEN6_9BURK
MALHHSTVTTLITGLPSDAPAVEGGQLEAKSRLIIADIAAELSDDHWRIPDPLTAGQYPSGQLTLNVLPGRRSREVQVDLHLLCAKNFSSVLRFHDFPRSLGGEASSS